MSLYYTFIDVKTDRCKTSQKQLCYVRNYYYTRNMYNSKMKNTIVKLFSYDWLHHYFAQYYGKVIALILYWGILLKYNKLFIK